MPRKRSMLVAGSTFLGAAASMEAGNPSDVKSKPVLKFGLGSSKRVQFKRVSRTVVGLMVMTSSTVDPQFVRFNPRIAV